MIFKGVEGHLFREWAKNSVTLGVLFASVVRKGRICLLKCCPSHTSIIKCLKYVLNMDSLDMTGICTVRSEWSLPPALIPATALLSPVSGAFCNIAHSKEEDKIFQM